MSLLNINNLNVEVFNNQKSTKLLDNLCLNIEAGKIIGIAGESGCGKTMTALTLLNLLPEHIKVTSGEIIFNNENILNFNKERLKDFRGSEISMVFQEPFSSLNPVIKIGRQAEDILQAHQLGTLENSKKRIIDLFNKVNLRPAERFVNSYPHQLSGGERQRVMIAMAISLNPKVLIADEPTSALDIGVQEELIKLIMKLRKEMGLSVIFISHDLRLMEKIADYVYIMYLGKVFEECSKEELFKTPLNPYTKGLFRSMPKPNLRGGKLKAIAGLPGDLADLPSGCVFHPRCDIAEDRCKDEKQNLETKKSDHKSRCWKSTI